mmetsp:Transcript_28028/g.34234  ORF Transcript_28028/g.34234 Transcript_28028/m.34234 type:complete len:94 (+) Transcript_28028:477-758(+)
MDRRSYPAPSDTSRIFFLGLSDSLTLLDDIGHGPIQERRSNLDIGVVQPWIPAPRYHPLIHHPPTKTPRVKTLYERPSSHITLVPSFPAMADH